MMKIVKDGYSLIIGIPVVCLVLGAVVQSRSQMTALGL